MSYGTRVVASGATSDPYGQRYKGIWICLDLLKTALAGNYVNFGVFELYGDPALKVSASCQCTRDAHCHAHRTMGESLGSAGLGMNICCVLLCTA